MSFEPLLREVSATVRTEREDRQRLTLGGRVFTSTVVLLLSGSVVVAAAGIFIITCVAAVKGVLWMWGQ